jgi:hypothetical protein
MSDPSRIELEAQIIAKAWKDAAFKQRLLADPKAVYAEILGQTLADNLEIKIVEETPTTLYLVLPENPDASGELSDEELDTVAGGLAGAACAPPLRTTRPTVTAGCSNCIPCITAD